MQEKSASISYLFGLRTTDTLDFFVSFNEKEIEHIIGEMMVAAGLSKKHIVPESSIMLYENIFLDGVSWHRDTLYDFVQAIINTKKQKEDTKDQLEEKINESKQQFLVHGAKNKE